MDWRARVASLVLGLALMSFGVRAINRFPRWKAVHQNGRPMCGRCMRPPVICVCEALPDQPIRTNRTSLLVLQHPAEARKRMSTTPLLPLCLEDCEVVVGHEFHPGDVPKLDAALASTEAKPVLVFPGRGVQTLDSFVQQERAMEANALAPGPQQRYTLILVDGTWIQAKRTMRVSPALWDARAHRVQFTDTVLSDLEPIRKEPENHCMSTAEAAAFSLAALDGSTEALQGAEAVRSALRKMVSIQLGFALKSEPRHRDIDRRVSSRKQARQALLKYPEFLQASAGGTQPQPRKVKKPGFY